ncbi:pentapeptide repeat-containing protein [Azospirillum palustre]
MDISAAPQDTPGPSLIDKTLNFLEKDKFIKIIVRIGQTIGWLGVLIAASTFVYNYVKDKNGRIEQSHFQAWNLISMQSGKPGNGGQIQALEALCRDRVSLHGVSLRGAFLDGVNLKGADADVSDFRNAQMEDSNLSYTSFSGADFSGANLAGSVMVAFNNPHVDEPIKEMKIGKFDPNYATRPQGSRDESALNVKITPRELGVNFKDSNLTTTKLMYANLRYAILRNSEIDRSKLYKADFRNADLSGASLSGADITEANFGSDREAAIVTQSQIESACADPKHPPHLPTGMLPPSKACIGTWK